MDSNFYVPWDYSYFLIGVDYLKRCIGAIMIYAALGFAAVFGVCLVISVVRRFLHS